MKALVVETQKLRENLKVVREVVAKETKLKWKISHIT